MTTAQWQFWIDRGGTFTDIVAQSPAGDISVHKLLSESPRYRDAAMQGIREILGVVDAPLPATEIAAIKMGTTVATNALLERKGDRTVLLITQGFRDGLRIGYQNRPQIFAQQIILPEMLYERVIEIEERYSAQGEELQPLQVNDALLAQLQTAYNEGIRSCAIVLLHSYRYPQHEQALAAIVRRVGFTQVSVSHQVSPLMKLVGRGDTTVVDAYLSPILRRYVEGVVAESGWAVEAAHPQLIQPQLMFMQSNGGLTDAARFQGKDSILSGPAGGIVGAVKTSAMAGFDRIIGFDMGGTSTDVSHFNGEYERTFETEVAGVRLRSPMMAIHTVAAGGGSIVSFDGARYRVGPESAGANPGPACYRRGGPLTVTDCNVLVGKVQPDFFPKTFGPDGHLPLDRDGVRQQFQSLAAAISPDRSPEQVAAGFLAIAIDKMANAIKKISIQRGYDVTKYTLCCFGGAGGQHACLIAEALGMSQIFIHPFAGVLSAYGMGLADQRSLKEKALEVPLVSESRVEMRQAFEELAAASRAELLAAGASVTVLYRAHLRYEGTDSAVPVQVNLADLYADADADLYIDAQNIDAQTDRPTTIPIETQMRSQFEEIYQQRYGFTMSNRGLIVEALSVEAIAATAAPVEPPVLPRTQLLQPVAQVEIFTQGQWHPTPVYQRQDLRPGDRIQGAALLVEPTGTNVVEPGWTAEVGDRHQLVLRRQEARQDQRVAETDRLRIEPPPKSPILGDFEAIDDLNDLAVADPVLLEIFNNLFRAIAEQMGITLQNTSYSVNMKERLDFSCALFDHQGQLVANAPHIPVHLGSMSESVQSLIDAKGNELRSGDVYVSNNPYNGGTHLPDITVITPVFLDHSQPLFYLASRGHHADIGGITPGSMPPHSRVLEEEGILLDNVLLVEQGRFCESELLERLTHHPYPARNPTQNFADLQAQIAANAQGVHELKNLVERYGLDCVQAYMQHVQDNAEDSVRQVIEQLENGNFTVTTDDGFQIQVNITIDRPHRSAHIDFTGTSPQQANNFNAPIAICKAAVLYVFRTLVEDDIPLNAGCLRPLTLTVPPGCLLNPQPPAAVVAGNVETSQAIVNALYGALGVMAAAQGTMNNFTFGNDQYQYYETICGGSGAGRTFDGTDAVQTHMTNSRLTDPEVLEWRFPVLVESFGIRQGSGGGGQNRGGNGVVRRIQFRSPMTAAILSGQRHIAPFGLQGGQPGQPGRNWVERQDGSVEMLDSKAEVAMEIGDRFVIETPGGGGYGAIPAENQGGNGGK